MAISINDTPQIYSAFNSSIQQPVPAAVAQPSTNDKVTIGWQDPSPVYTQPVQKKTPPENQIQDEKPVLEQLMQAMLDRRTGLDREKWDELQEKIDELQSLDELSDDQKKQLEQLLKQQEELTKEAAERMTEQAEKQTPQAAQLAQKSSTVSEPIADALLLQPEQEHGKLQDELI